MSIFIFLVQDYFNITLRDTLKYDELFDISYVPPKYELISKEDSQLIQMINLNQSIRADIEREILFGLSGLFQLFDNLGNIQIEIVSLRKINVILVYDIYFNLIPFDLINTTIPYFDNDDLTSFVSIYSLKDQLDWKSISFSHFGRSMKVTDYNDYFTYLSIEKLKQKLKLTGSVEEIYNLESLNLSDRNFPILPKEIGNLTNLKTLFLSHNEIRELPREIGNLIKLKELILGSNQIRSLPKEIGNLINLDELVLNFNFIRELPKEIGNLINLKIFTITNNNLSKVPKEIGNLINLEILALSHNNIKQLPLEISNLKKLNHLYLYGSDFNKEEINKLKAFLSHTRIYTSD